MNKFFIILLISVILSIATGCSIDSSEPSQPSYTNSSAQLADGGPTAMPTPSEISKSTGEEKMDNNCKLIVKCRDITSENFVYLNEEYQDVELPLTAVMKELGAKVEWQNTTTVKITYDGSDYILDTTEQAFGLPRPPGSTHYVRRVIDNEVIIDGTSAKGLLNWVGAKLNINYDEKIVEIE